MQKRLFWYFRVLSALHNPTKTATWFPIINFIFVTCFYSCTIFALADTKTYHTPNSNSLFTQKWRNSPHTLFRGYRSKLFSLSKKSKSPIVRIPSSFRRGMMWSLTMIIFLKESSMLTVIGILVSLPCHSLFLPTLAFFSRTK